MCSVNMELATPPYRYRLCDAASYRRFPHRGLNGVMQYSDLYRCNGCSVTFSDPVAWRKGEQVALMETEADEALAVTRAAKSARSAVHSLAAGHIV